MKVQKSYKNMTLEKLAAMVAKGFEELNSRIDRLEVRMDRLEERMDKIEVRMDRMEIKMDQAIYRSEFEQLKSRVKILEQKKNKK